MRHHIIIITAIYNYVVKNKKEHYLLFRSALIATKAVRVRDGVDIQKYIYVTFKLREIARHRARRPGGLDAMLSVNVGTF